MRFARHFYADSHAPEPYKIGASIKITSLERLRVALDEEWSTHPLDARVEKLARVDRCSVGSTRHRVLDGRPPGALAKFRLCLRPSKNRTIVSPTTI